MCTCLHELKCFANLQLINKNFQVLRFVTQVRAKLSIFKNAARSWRNLIYFAATTFAVPSTPIGSAIHIIIIWNIHPLVSELKRILSFCTFIFPLLLVYFLGGTSVSRYGVLPSSKFLFFCFVLLKKKNTKKIGRHANCEKKKG